MLKPFKIRGVKHYKGIHQGIKKLANSSELDSMALEAAKSVAAVANQTGRSEYTAKRTTVRSGKYNELRSGATVTQDKQNWFDTHNKVLVNALKTVAKDDPRKQLFDYVRKDGKTIKATQAQIDNWTGKNRK